MPRACGDTDQACHWFDCDHAKRNLALIYVRSDPSFDKLVSHPRIARIVSAMKFSPTTELGGKK